jgi:hypothetical protein
MCTLRVKILLSHWALKFLFVSLYAPSEGMNETRSPELVYECGMNTENVRDAQEQKWENFNVYNQARLRTGAMVLMILYRL